MATGSGEKAPAGAMSGRFMERPSDEEIEKIEEERKEVLAPENRPPNTEVDNTQRDFDTHAGMYTDDPRYADLSEEDKPFEEEPTSSPATAPDGHTDVGSGPGSEQAEDAETEEAGIPEE